MLDLVARLSTGADIPDAPGERFPRVHSVVISAEDSNSKVLVPRLMDLQADLDRVWFFHPDWEANYSLATLDYLESLRKQIGPELKLIAIDPPTSYLGKTNEHSNAELRALLAPLTRWADQHGIVILLLTHFGKDAKDQRDLIARVIGSVAWVNIARSVFGFMADPGDRARRLLVHTKNSYGPLAPTLAYRIVELPAGDVVVDWLGRSTLTADNAIQSIGTRDQQAVAFLTEAFRQKREWASKEIHEHAKQHGLDHNNITSPATQSLPILKEPPTTNRPHWIWRAKPGWPI
jgi:hypothetical protein